MTGRHTVDSITSDELDQLYDTLDELRKACTHLRRHDVDSLSAQWVLDLLDGAATEATEPAECLAQHSTPREHCGDIAPTTLLTTRRTECVLRPGHSGSHADDRGCRWWLDPTAADEPALSDPPGTLRPRPAGSPLWHQPAACSDRFTRSGSTEPPRHPSTRGLSCVRGFSPNRCHSSRAPFSFRAASAA